MTNAQKIKLIYVLGSGHSGSTLTDLILGSHSSIESVGELFQLPEYVSPQSTRADDRRICTCGIHISKCNYWNSIFNQVSNPLVYEINSKNNFGQNNYDLMKSILTFTGKKILLDSSKIPSRLQNLIQSERFEILVIHLVRDGRAVGYSGKRKQEKLKSEFGESYQQEILKMNKKVETYDLYGSVKSWSRENLDHYKTFSNDSRVQYLSVKYEDLVRNPKQKISDILKFFNLEFEPQQLKFYELEHHNISGNRMRLGKETTIALDEEYKKNLSTLDWWKCTGIAYKGLQLFNYPWGRKR